MLWAILWYLAEMENFGEKWPHIHINKVGCGWRNCSYWHQFCPYTTQYYAISDKAKMSSGETYISLMFSDVIVQTEHNVLTLKGKCWSVVSLAEKYGGQIGKWVVLHALPSCRTLLSLFLPIESRCYCDYAILFFRRFLFLKKVCRRIAAG